MVSHGSEVTKTICEQHGVDYIDVLNNKKGGRAIQEDSNKVRNVSVGVSAAVTSYSSIFMSETKNFILSQGGKIYYTDTDSIVTDIQLPSKYVGSGIGLFKLEHKVLRGYFISSKLYCLVIWDDNKKVEKVIIKAKVISAAVG